MKRIIKFRGKSIADETWVFGDLVQTPDKKTAIWPVESKSQMGVVEVYPDSVGQYTNILDRNKKEIYEGDIVRQTWETTIANEYDEAWDAVGLQKGVVVIRTQGVCISPCITTNDTNGDTTITKNKRIAGYRCEILGNKYDNPDIMNSLYSD